MARRTARKRPPRKEVATCPETFAELVDREAADREARALRLPNARVPVGPPTIALPSIAEGWSAEVQSVIRTAYFWRLDGPTCGVDRWDGPVPTLTIADVLQGVSDLASCRPELTPAEVIDILFDAMGFVDLMDERLEAVGWVASLVGGLDS